MGAPGPVMVVDPHALFRSGVAECLTPLAGVSGIAEAASVEAARADPTLGRVLALIIDHELPGAPDLMSEVAGHARIIACISGPLTLRRALRDGATGVLAKATLTPDALVAAFEGTGAGMCVVMPELLGAVVTSDGARDVPARPREPRDVPVLSHREQRVMGLIADGHVTREVARRLSYSERTVKNVVHDVVTKLGARSRAEAVAHAVRDGLI